MIVDTAHRGFVRHLPVVGDASDEFAGLLYILNASPEQRRSWARDSRWRDLATLPSMVAVFEDPDLMADVDRVARGNLVALYRLQRHPRILDLIEDPRIADLAASLRPSRLADELRGLSGASPAESGAGKSIR